MKGKSTFDPAVLDAVAKWITEHPRSDPYNYCQSLLADKKPWRVRKLIVAAKSKKRRSTAQKKELPNTPRRLSEIFRLPINKVKGQMLGTAKQRGGDAPAFT